MPSKIGRPREPTFRVKEILNNRLSDSNSPGKKKAWHEYSVGEKHRFTDIFTWNLGRKPLNHLFSINKKKPNILFLGPGKGEYIIPFKEELKFKGLEPEIDVFGLLKDTLSASVKPEIKNDFSMATPFESLDPEIKEHKNFFLKTIGKYDLIIAPMSVAYQTKYPSFALYQSALMLNKGGKAYLEVRSINSAKLADNKYGSQLLQLEKVFNRLINNYNKNYNQNNKYSFKILGDLKTNPFGVFVEIERIN